MKKIAALVLSLALALSLATVAFAANPTDTYYTTMTAGTNTKTAEYFKANTYKASAVAEDNWLDYIRIDGDLYFVGGTTGDALYMAGGAKAPVTLGDRAVDTDIFYNYTAKAFGEQKWSCTTDGVKADYTYVDENGDTCYANKDAAAGDIGLLVNGKVVLASKTDVQYKAGHILAFEGTDQTKDLKEVGVGVYEVYCLACKQNIKISDKMVNGAGYLYTKQFDTADLSNIGVAMPVGVKLLEGSWYIVGTGTTTATGVESPKTFDAGIAMYVGMGLMAVTGSAVVIGKKKEF